ncbi:hemerythrin domain-containing protein [Kitasatospora sp. A2-31]|uniref:hemerythrin domain-containing protein n=1 Tax=Kitasatospora sp. A2-31 TaxID=2916414 RepID=UPI001EE8E956|nr:hemerythrin domain-containing protein [Kitasatospora sp. A2-31]MCG6492886.1 hemerythrin domain-containing protein [Kitasatospora sp. A2-31]
MSRRPDILGEFTADHRAVTELLARIEAASTDDRQRNELVDQLTDLLFSHCAAEEEHLFPVVQHDVPDGGALVFACIHDHLTIGQYLSDLQGLGADEPTFGTLLQGLADTVRRHLATEEKGLFPAARKALPAGSRAALGEHLRNERAAVAEAGPPAGTEAGTDTGG